MPRRHSTYMPKKSSLPTRFGLLPFLFLIITILTGFVSFIARPAGETEPLADAPTLDALVAGVSVPPPVEESYAVFHGDKATPPALASLATAKNVLGQTTNASDKRIEVDLTNQKVYAIEGDRIVHQFIVSTGKWGRTPTGEFTIWTKVRSQLMKGGSRELGTYYYLPNVPYVMFFSNDEIAKMRGFSFHGTYWHDNFGHPMSHGCINMRTEDAKTLYEWATPIVTNAKAWSTPSTPENPGTKVTIYGKAPRN